MSQADADSLERIVPESLVDSEATGRETLELHLARYRFALTHLRAGRVLDLACGVGYGSRMLVDGAGVTRVIGADLSADAIAYAHTMYVHPRIDYVRGSGAEYLRTEAFTTIVSLETVEHVESPRDFLASLRARLAPGGVLVASVPTTPSVDANPHHRTDFTERSFLQIGAALDLTPLALLRQVQHFNPVAVVGRKERRSRDLRRNLLGYYATHPDALWRRLYATLRYGFTNRYLTVAWQRRT